MKAAVAIVRRHGKAVHFQFRHVLEALLFQKLPNARIEIAKLLLVQGVVEAQHGRAVLNTLQAFARLASHSLRRRIGRHQFRVLLFELLETTHQSIVLGVGDHRLIEDIIQVLVPLNFFAEPLNFMLNRVFHGIPSVAKTIMMGLDHAHSSYRQAAVIYNPCAGRLARRAHLLQRSIELLRQQGTEATLIPTTGPGTAGTLAKREIDNGADLIVAAGGDGTINEILNGMVHSRIPLAILPGGTANVLAHELKIKHGFLHAVSSIASLEPCRISLGVMRAAGYERYFLLMAGIGLDAQIVYDLNLDLKAAAGKLAYYMGGMMQLLRPIPQFDVNVSGERHRCGFALISNVRNYGGDLEIARGASLLRDDFELVLFEGSGSLGYLRYLLGVALKRVDRLQGCTVLRSTSITCEAASDPAVYTQIDGELASRLPVKIEVEPNALTLLVPSAYLLREQSFGKAAA